MYHSVHLCMYNENERKGQRWKSVDVEGMKTILKVENAEHILSYIWRYSFNYTISNLFNIDDCR